MKITAKIDRMLDGAKKSKAFASVYLDDAVVVRDVAVMEGKNGLFAKLPFRSYTDSKGATQYTDVVSASNQNVREAINRAVLGAYNAELSQKETADENYDFFEGEDEDPPFEPTM